MRPGGRGIIIDGFLTTVIAVCTPLLGVLMADDVFKYINPTTVWWARTSVIVIGAAAGGLKAFRSTAFAHHIDEGNRIDAREDARLHPNEATIRSAYPDLR